MLQSKRGFTLIELLVVIAIISLLVSVLLPALGVARNAARTMQCAANLRQVQIGIIAYTHNNQGSLPFSSWAGDTNRLYRFWGGGVYSYVGSVPAFYCPEQSYAWRSDATRKSMEEDPDYFWWQAVGYGVNRYGAMPAYSDRVENYYPANIDDPRLPASQVISVTENYRLPNDLPAAYPQMDGYFMIAQRSSHDRLASHRHRDQANVAFMDGHVVVMRDRELGYDTPATAWLTADEYDRTKAPWFIVAPWVRR